MDSSEKIAQQFYSRLGADRLEKQTTPKRDKKIVQNLLGMLDPEMKILDAGCGYGRIAIPLAQAGYSVTGLDLVPELLVSAREKGNRSGVDVSWIQGSMCDLESAVAEKFDVILCLWSAFWELLHEHEQIATLQGFYNALNPGGWALLEGPCPEKYNSEGVRKEKDLQIMDVQGLDYHLYRHTFSSLARLVRKSDITRFQIYKKNWSIETRLFLRFEK